jgi:predicted metalloprotease with PDZ domain
MQLLITRVSRLRSLKFSLVWPLILLLFAAVETEAQSAQVSFSMEPTAPASLGVEISGAATRAWSFPNSYGNLVDLSNRIENVSGANSAGRTVAIARVAPGEWRADEDVTQLSYRVRLNMPSRSADLSHVSWVSGDYGLLMLRDLLPQEYGAAMDLRINLPAGWSSASALEPSGPFHYRINGADKILIAVGRSLREKTSQSGSSKFKVITTGKWAFKDADQLKVVRQLLDEHLRIFRRPLPSEPAVVLIPLPEVSTSDRWTAETRGSTVLLLMGNQAKRKQALARLRVVLAHELFHLWVPNALDLKGDYDWFFEGFTVYQALLTGLRLHYIDFEDYLETLGRVYDSYRASSERDKLSLLEASERRWTSASSLVYDKGALVAFIYDLMLRKGSGGRTTVNDIYLELQQTASNGRHNGNELVMRLLDGRAGMDRFSESYVRSTTEIDLPTVLAQFGLEVVSEGSRFRIQVSNKINSDQRQLLKSLGYK